MKPLCELIFKDRFDIKEKVEEDKDSRFWSSFKKELEDKITTLGALTYIESQDGGRSDLQSAESLDRTRNTAMKSSHYKTAETKSQKSGRVGTADTSKYSRNLFIQKRLESIPSQTTLTSKDNEIMNKQPKSPL